MNVDLKANIRTVDRWILDMRKDLFITENKPFAAGNFGELYRGKLVPENKVVAVKKIRRNLDDMNTTRRYTTPYVTPFYDHPCSDVSGNKLLHDEIEAMKICCNQHENIVLLHG